MLLSLTSVTEIITSHDYHRYFIAPSFLGDEYLMPPRSRSPAPVQEEGLLSPGRTGLAESGMHARLPVLHPGVVSEVSFLRIGDSLEAPTGLAARRFVS